MKKFLFLQSIVLFVCFMFLNSSLAQDTPQWHLPEGVKARIGKGSVIDIALSPDGTQLAVATSIGVWLYNARTGIEIALLTGHTQSVRSVAYSPNGNTLASCSYDEIILWDPRVQTQKTIFEGTGGGKLIYSPDGLTLAVGVWGGVDLLNAQTGEHKLFVSGHSGGNRSRQVPEFALSSDGNTLATTAGDPEDQKTIFLWNARTGRMLRTLTGHEDRVYTITFSPNGKTLASQSWNTILFWDAKTGRLQQTLYTSKSYSIAYSPDGETLATGGIQNVYFWNTRTDQPQTPLKTSGSIRSVLFSDSSTLVTRDSDGGINFWDVQTGSHKLTIEGHLYFRAVALSPNGKTLATNTNQGIIFLWDALNGRFNKVLTTAHWDSSLAYSPDSNTLAIRVWEPPDRSMIHLLNARDGRLLRGFGAPGVSFTTFVFSPDGKTLACGGRDGRISLWNTNEGRPLRTLTGHERLVSNITFSPDGKTLASSSYDEARLWDVNSGRPLRTLTGHTSHIYSLAFSPSDGKTLAIAGSRILLLLDAKTGQLQRTLSNTSYLSVAYSPDGKTLATGNWDGEVHLWDAKTYQLQRTLLGDKGPSRWLAFSLDGSRLISETSGVILLWDLDVPQPSEDTRSQQPGGVVNMPDANLAAAVRKTLGLGANAPITQRWMQRLTHLRARKVQIKNLTGLEHATRLVDLALYHNQIQSVKPLEGLTQLQRLYIQDNQIADITPLAKLTQLSLLHLWGNRIRDITALERLTQLESLWLENNQIRDISPLANLTKLTDLRLRGNPIQDMAPLRTLKAQNPELKLDIEIPPPIPAVHIKTAQRPPMYWVDTNAGTLHRLVGDEVENFLTSVQNTTSLALDATNGKIYWTEQTGKNKGSIKRANLDGSNVQILATLQSVATSIAVDTANSKLYWTNSRGKIQQANLNGKPIRNLIQNLKAPSNITLDAADGKLYWMETASRIRRADLNGKNIQNIASGLDPISDLAIAGNKIYWTEIADESSGKIGRANLNGSNARTLASLKSAPSGIVIDPVGRKLYWADSGGNITRANLNGKKVQNVVSGLSAPANIVLGSVPAATPAAPTHVAEIPAQTALLANYPNPFNPETWIPYQLVVQSDVKITIYDTRGAVVRQLVLGHQPAGTYTSRSRAAYWDGRNNQGERVASGIYFYQLQTDNVSSLRKMLILK